MSTKVSVKCAITRRRRNVARKVSTWRDPTGCPRGEPDVADRKPHPLPGHEAAATVTAAGLSREDVQLQAAIWASCSRASRRSQSVERTSSEERSRRLVEFRRIMGYLDEGKPSMFLNVVASNYHDRATQEAVQMTECKKHFEGLASANPTEH